MKKETNCPTGINLPLKSECNNVKYTFDQGKMFFVPILNYVFNEFWQYLGTCSNLESGIFNITPEMPKSIGSNDMNYGVTILSPRANETPMEFTRLPKAKAEILKIHLGKQYPDSKIIIKRMKL